MTFVKFEDFLGVHFWECRQLNFQFPLDLWFLITFFRLQVNSVLAIYTILNNNKIVIISLSKKLQGDDNLRYFFVN